MTKEELEFVSKHMGIVSVDLHRLILDLLKDYDYSQVDNIMSLILENCPDNALFSSN